VLRPLRLEDASDYVRAFADDPDLGRLVGVEEDPTEEQFAQRVAQARQWAKDGKAVELAVCAAGDGNFAGTVLAHSLAWHHRRCEVGFWIAPAVRRQGLASAAVGAVLGWLFDELAIERVEMTTTPDNGPTRAMALRLGFVEEGVLRARNLERGRRVDLVMFGLLREEWLGGGS
jgi:RimJ/RimL family protein N-acetyltransferase